MFEAFYSPEAVAKILIPRSNYHPFPKCGEPNTLTESRKRAMILAGEQQSTYSWPIGTAMDYLNSIRLGNRQIYEGTVYRERRNALLALMDAEYAENKGRFIPQIINGIWAIMDEATWVVPAHNGEWYIRHGSSSLVVKDTERFVLPNFDDPIIIDLFAAGTAGMLAHAYYLFKDQIDAVSPLILRRMELVMEERIFKPFMENVYWWTGLGYYNPPNNWNPWILSNVLACYGFICADEEKRAAAIARACIMLDKFVAGYSEDGGCDEGPSYWGVAGASLFDCLCELGDLMGNAFESCLEQPLVQNIGRYIYRAHIAGPYFTNYADAPRHFEISCDLVYRYGKKIRDDNMIRLAVAMHHLYGKGNCQGQTGMDSPRYYRHMQAILGEAELAAEKCCDFPLVEDVFMDGVQQMAARQKGGTTEGLYLSAKGGNNGESHNHNDIGSFILYSDGQPVVVDIGSGLYNAKTFSPRRYEILQMQSSYHNLPEINGVMQHAGAEYAARDVSYTNENGVTVFTQDIAAAYPAEAGVTTWKRTFTFDRGAGAVTIADEAAFAGEKNHTETMFITPVQPEICGDTAVVPAGDARSVAIICQGATLTAEAVDLTFDPNLTDHWNGQVWRIKACADCGSTHTQVFTIAQK